MLRSAGPATKQNSSRGSPFNTDRFPQPINYDRFGEKQDGQGFYEDPALNELVAHASLQEARCVFEFGCGTGKFAGRVLEKSMLFSARYLGCDISPVMIGLA